MTLQKAKSIARHLGLTLRDVCSGNYRVNFRDGNETTAYYTDNLEDAVNTAVEIARRRVVTEVCPNCKQSSCFCRFNSETVITCAERSPRTLSVTLMTAKVIRRASPTLPSSPFFGNPIDGIAACCARRERPRGRRAAEQRDERAPSHHSITSSARASIVPHPCL